MQAAEPVCLTCSTRTGRLLESADMAALLREMGSSCRTPAAVRDRVRRGVMNPRWVTVRGGYLWTRSDAQEELAIERQRMREPHLRLVPRRPRQMVLRW